MTTEASRSVSRRSPSYELVAQAVLSDIESGRYPINSQLPTENELAQQFGMSRHTIREALRRLQQMGVVSRRQGVGTRVASKTARTGYVQRAATIADLIQYAKDVRLVVDTEEEVLADAALAGRLGCRVGQRWLRFTGLRYETESTAPICFTEVYVSYEFASIRDRVKTSSKAIYALIEETFGERITEVQQRIEAAGIAEDLAGPLDVESGSPGLHIERYYRSAMGRILEVAFSIYPVGRFSYDSRLTLDSALERAG